MKNQYQKTIVYIFIITILSSCSSHKVVSDIDNTVDFSQFGTFEYLGWAENSDQVLTRFDKDRIENSFAEEAQKRGMTRVQSNGDVIASLFVVGQVKTQQTAQTTTMGTGGMHGMHGMHRRGMRNPGWGWGATHSTTVINEKQYLEGTLVIELYDQKDRKLIWQAIGTKKVSDNRQRRAEDISDLVAAIMKKYPVAPIKK